MEESWFNKCEIGIEHFWVPRGLPLSAGQSCEWLCKWSRGECMDLKSSTELTCTQDPLQFKMAPTYRVRGRVSAMFACVNDLTGFACGWRILLWQRNHRTPSKCCWNLGPWNKVSVLQWGTSARERDWDRTVEFYSWKGPCRRVNSNLLPVEDPRLHQWQSDAETTCLLMPFFIPRGHSQLLTKHPYFLERVVKAGQTFTVRHLDGRTWRAGCLLIARAAISAPPRVPIWP